MRLLRAILAGVLGASAALVVACGDSNGLLAGNDASGLNSKLDAISAAVDGGHCAAAGRRVAELQDAVVNLPGTVDRRLLTDLRDGTRTVGAQAATACQEAATTTTETTDTETTDTTPTETTPTATTPTQTVTTPTQPVTTPTQTVTTPTTTTPPTTTPTTPPTPTTTTPGGGGAGPGTGTGGGGGAPGQ